MWRWVRDFVLLAVTKSLSASDFVLRCSRGGKQMTDAAITLPRWLSFYCLSLRRIFWRRLTFGKSSSQIALEETVTIRNNNTLLLPVVFFFLLLLLSRFEMLHFGGISYRDVCCGSNLMELDAICFWRRQRRKQIKSGLTTSTALLEIRIQLLKAEILCARFHRKSFCLLKHSHADSHPPPQKGRGLWLRGMSSVTAAPPGRAATFGISVISPLSGG